MSRKIQEAYLRLSEAISENPPVCSEPEYQDLFFSDFITPGRPVSLHERQVLQREAEAKIVCNFCPVKQLCAEYAIIAAEPFGIWGATSPAERKAIYASAKANKTGVSKATQLFD